MKTYGYDGSAEFRPLSPWAYVRYSLLFAIPIVGLIVLLVFTFSKKNINRRSYARSVWCGILLAVIVWIVLAILAYTNVIPSVSVPLRQYFGAHSYQTNDLGGFVGSLFGNEAKKAELEIDPADVPKGVSLEFYKTMVSYELFFDEYIKFMDRYTSSNNQAGMMMDYLNFMTRYTDAMEKLEKIDEDKLSPEEDKFYLEVLLRINTKLSKHALTLN